jgi:hypothetical protein
MGNRFEPLFANPDLRIFRRGSAYSSVPLPNESCSFKSKLTLDALLSFALHASMVPAYKRGMRKPLISYPLAGPSLC